MKRGLSQAWTCWKKHWPRGRVFHLHNEWAYLQWYCKTEGCPYVYGECQVLMTHDIKVWAVYEILTALCLWLYRPYKGSGRGRGVYRIRLADWIGCEKMYLLARMEGLNGTIKRTWL